MKKVWLCFMFFMVAYTTWAGQAKKLLLEGTIDKYPIVFLLQLEGTEANAVYYYKNQLRDINLEGSYNKGTIILSNYSTDNNTDKKTKLETFTISSNNNKTWSGTWQNKKHLKYKVSLSIVNAAVINNRWDKYDFVKALKYHDTFQFYRTSFFKIVADSTFRYGKITVKRYNAIGTGLYAYVIEAGIQDRAKQKIKTYLINDLLERVYNYYNCNTEWGYGTYSLDVPYLYLGAHVYSMQRVEDVSCGGAHPDVGFLPLTFNLQTGDALQLEDVLHLTDIEVPEFNSDNWLAYRDEKYAPLLVKFFQQLHPTEMNKAENDCDYNDASHWAYSIWWVTEKGLYISPVFPHVAAPCNLPDFTNVPFNTLKKYAGKVPLP